MSWILLQRREIIFYLQLSGFVCKLGVCLCVCVCCSAVQVLTMKSLHSLAGVLLVLGFVQSSWQVPLPEADDSLRYRTQLMRLFGVKTAEKRKILSQKKC